MTHIASKNRHQRGVSTTTVAFAIAVIAISLVGWSRKQLNSAQEKAGASLGYSINQVSLGVDNYRFTYLKTLTTATPAVTGFANPMAPTVAELKAKGLITASVFDTLPDGNAYRIQVVKQPVGCVGPSTLCNVYSILSLTEPIVEDNGNPSVIRLGALIAAIQDSASFSTSQAPTTITGGNGAWVVPNPDTAQRAGILVVIGGLGGSGSLYLYPGDPRDANWSGNSTTAGYGKVSAGPGQTVVSGDVCTDPTGAYRNDTVGRILSCQGGKWTATDGGKSIVLRAPVSGVVGGTSFAVDTCPPGGAAWATYSAQTSAVNVTVSPPLEVLTYTVSMVGSDWVTLTQATAPPAAPVTVNNNSAILGVVPQGVFSSGCSF